MYLISYDIQDDQLRTKVAKALVRYGMYRVQYSVFMGELKTRPLGLLQKALTAHSITASWTEADSIMILPLHQYSKDMVTFLGKKPDHWIEMRGELHTLML